jgi:hypothetical protein
MYSLLNWETIGEFTYVHLKNANENNRAINCGFVFILSESNICVKKNSEYMAL